MPESRHRIPLDVSETLDQQIVEVQKLFGATTKAEAIRRSIQTIHALKRQIETSPDLTVGELGNVIFVSRPPKN